MSGKQLGPKLGCRAISKYKTSEVGSAGLLSVFIDFPVLGAKAFYQCLLGLSVFL